jgi:hypothetical protein
LVAREDAEGLGCLKEVKAKRDIIRRGISAHHPLTTYSEPIWAGADRHAILLAVIDILIAQTASDL